LLYNQTAKRLKAALIDRGHAVVGDVPCRRGGRPHTESKADAEPRPDGER